MKICTLLFILNVGFFLNSPKMYNNHTDTIKYFLIREIWNAKTLVFTFFNTEEKRLKITCAIIP